MTTERNPTMKALILFLALGACGASDAVPLDDAGNPIVDAAPGPQGLVELPLDCVDYTREVRHASTDNSRDVTINSFATVDLAPGTDFVLSVCDAPVVPACSGGDVCTGTDAPSAAQVCAVRRGSAEFFDGKLTILCKARTERYLASGTMTSSTATTFTVKLEVFQ